MRPLLGSVESSLQPRLDHDDDGQEHFRDDDGEADAAGAREGGERPRYEPLAREPRFARAGHTPLWELYALAAHVHPSVAFGATKLLHCEPYRDAGDNPFEVLSCGQLLETFVLASRAHRDGKDKGRDKRSKVARVAFTSEHFSRKKHVPAHEKFFQLYFCDATVRAAQRRKAQSKRQQEEDVDEEGADAAADDGDEEEEEDKFFDEYIQGQMPKDGDEDEDVDIDDDSDDDGSAGGASDAPEGAESDEAGAQPSGEEDEDSEPDDAFEHRGKKRPAPASKAQRIKALKKKHSGSTFASIEDFEQLLAEDFP